MIATPDFRALFQIADVVTPAPHPDALDESDFEGYRRDGYLAVEGLLSPAEVAAAEAALGDLLRGRVAGFDGVQPEPELRVRWESMSPEERERTARKLWLFAAHEPRMEALTRHPAIHRILERLIGEPCALIQDMALLKPALVGSEKPWHQDMAYFDRSPPEKLVGVWLAIHPATVENGCMHVMPGSHRAGPVPHVHRRDCQIADERVAVGQAVAVPLAPGGALFFASLLQHGTPPNTSPERRWAIQFHYAGLSTERIDRREHAALYFEESRYAGCRGQMGTPLDELKP
jgi:phytanoyl-CoA hydroxylase